MTYREAIRELRAEGYRRLPRSAGATGSYTFHTYYNRERNALVDLCEYSRSRVEIENWRTRLS